MDRWIENEGVLDCEMVFSIPATSSINRMWLLGLISSGPRYSISKIG
jgi:hypothetical protein